jgi:homoserine O-acetyltransferase
MRHTLFQKLVRRSLPRSRLFQRRFASYQTTSGLIRPKSEFALANGGIIPASNLQMKYATFGNPSNPTVLIFPSLSNGCYVTDHPDIEKHLEENPHESTRRNSIGGPWWTTVVSDAASAGINLNNYFVISASPMGSPFGSTSPVTMPDFPMTINPIDQANWYSLFLDELGVDKVDTIVGASFGGMNTLQFAAEKPERYQKLVALACTALTSPSTIALRTVQRRCVEEVAQLMSLCEKDEERMEAAQKTLARETVRDKEGRDLPAEKSADEHVPLSNRGMAIARMIGMICYRSRAEFDDRFEWGSDQVEHYLRYHGDAFARHYDYKCYLVLSKCMDMMNIGRGTTYAEGAQRIPVDKEIMLLGYDTDYLIPPSELQTLAAVLGTRPKSRVYFEKLQSKYGHDAFMIDQKQVAYRINAFLEGGVDEVSSVVDEMYSQ